MLTACTSVSCAGPHHFTLLSPVVSAAVCLFQATPNKSSETFWLSITTSVKSQTLEDWSGQRHSTSDRWGSESERTGRRMLGGEGVVQGSWRPRYWTGFLLVCEVNRKWMARACISQHVLINKGSFMMCFSISLCLMVFYNNIKTVWGLKGWNPQRKLGFSYSKNLLIDFWCSKDTDVGYAYI